MRVWIDLENTPHAMVFRPIVYSLKARGHEVFVTAKDFGQTLGLLELFDIPHTRVGGGAVGNRVAKVLTVFLRALQLVKVVNHQDIRVSISHGSRSHIIGSYLAKIPCITAYDYEYSSKTLVHDLSTRVLVPAVLKDSPYFSNKTVPRNMRFYPGLKEELYICDFKPPDTPVLPVDPQTILAVIRPSATTAHYTTPLAVTLFHKIMERIKSFKPGELVVVLLPRTPQQAQELSEQYSALGELLVIPTVPLDGLELLWQADLVISAGGTMNRESAILGVPTYSIFTGPIGAVDQYLMNSGRIKHIDSEDKIREINFSKKNPNKLKPTSRQVLDFFLEQIEQFA